jgi:Tfp pilus assembly protein PilN
MKSNLRPAMRRLNIDFAPVSLRRAAAQTSVLTWLLGLSGLALCAVAAVMALGLLDDSDAAKNSLNRLLSQLQERSAAKPPVKKIMIPEAQANAINAVILQLNLPWSDLFDAVEEATPGTVALLALEPDAKKHMIKAIAEAKSSDEMIAYIERLKKQALFASVILSKHEVNEQDPNRPLRFQFEAQWKESPQ